MLKTSLKMKRSLTDVSHKEKRLSPLNENDWAVAEVVINISEMFFIATKKLEGDNSECHSSSRLYCVFMSIIQYLNQLCSSNDPNHDRFKQIFQLMKNKMDYYWNIIREYALILNTLDPKFKLDSLDEHEKIEARNALKSIYSNYQKQFQIKYKPITENPTNFIFEESIFASRNLAVSSSANESELDDYLSRPRLDLKENALSWWKQNSDKYPLLSKIAADYLGMMITSASCERFFSICGLNISKIRNRISCETSRRCLSLWSWNRYSQN
jgi:hypothetical protein